MDGPKMYTIKWGHLAHFPSKGKGCKGSERGVCWVCSICGSLVAVWQDLEGRGHRAWKDVVVVVNGDPFRHTTHFRKKIIIHSFQKFQNIFLRG